MALLLGLGAAGCSTSGGTAAPGPAPLPAPRPFQGVTHYPGSQLTALHTAEEELVAACMKRRGFTYRPQPLATGNHLADVNPYGLLSVAQAVNDGYGITSTALSMRPPADVNAAAGADKRWKEALLGTPAHRVNLAMPMKRQFFYQADSCVSDAKSRLFGADYYKLYNTFQVLSDAVVEKVRADRRYREAQTSWRTCMKAAGTEAEAFGDPQGTVDEQLRQAGQDPARLHAVAGVELKLSRADAGCQAETGLTAVVAAAQTDAEKTLGAGYADELAALRSMQRKALATASGD
ncbi:hypothetical protein [Streptomyces vietnamensis]|uniref:hypothetical protein n=1 Tax=Streptomyces vietnamensis TaxID=362257 RepID=UPI00099B6540|nr:hypothetical protein [Streptomyces vietnamensis]